MGTAVTDLFVASRAELSNGQATCSLRAAVLGAVRAPHHDRKAMAGTAGSLGKGVSPPLVNPSRPLEMGITCG